jgi:hypothetical protein
MSSTARPDVKPRPTRPPFDPAAFVVGAVLIVLAIIALLDPGLARRLDLAVIGPATLVGIGAVLLATTLGRDRGDGSGGSPPRSRTEEG